MHSEQKEPSVVDPHSLVEPADGFLLQPTWMFRVS